MDQNLDEADALDRLEEQSKSLFSRSERLLKNFDDAQKTAKIFLIIGGSAIATIAQFMGPAPDGAIPIKAILGVGGAIAALLGGILVAYTERPAGDALIEAQRANNDAKKFLANRGEILRLVFSAKAERNRYSTLFNTVMLLREYLEQKLAVKNSNLDILIDHILDASLMAMLGTMQLEAGEQWSISVFKADMSGQEPILIRVAQRRANRIEEKSETRKWKSGEGWGGTSYAQQREIIIPDTSDPAVRNLIFVTGDNVRPDDAERYKSVASIPIKVGPDGRRALWGVVVATTNQAGRFSPDAGTSASIAADAVRMLAGMLALAVASVQRMEQESS